MKNVCCPQCGATNVEQIALNKYACPYCGHVFISIPQNNNSQNPPVLNGQAYSPTSYPEVPQQPTQQPPQNAFYQQPSQMQAPYNMQNNIVGNQHPYMQNASQAFYNQQPQTAQQQVSTDTKSKKDKTTAALLAIFLGGLGIQDFYLGNYIWAVIALIFSWTYIPVIWGIIDGIKYLCMSEEKFQEKYNK